jgi:hypothetical protein
MHSRKRPVCEHGVPSRSFQYRGQVFNLILDEFIENGNLTNQVFEVSLRRMAKRSFVVSLSPQ